MPARRDMRACGRRASRRGEVQRVCGPGRGAALAVRRTMRARGREARSGFGPYQMTRSRKHGDSSEQTVQRGADYPRGAGRVKQGVGCGRCVEIEPPVTRHGSPRARRSGACAVSGRRERRGRRAAGATPRGKARDPCGDRNPAAPREVHEDVDVARGACLVARDRPEDGKVLHVGSGHAERKHTIRTKREQRAARRSSPHSAGTRCDAYRALLHIARPWRTKAPAALDCFGVAC